MSSPERLHGASVTGTRHADNQDRYLARAAGHGAVLAVADGMGGLAGGALAAQTAIDLVRARVDVAAVTPEALREIIVEAGERIAARADADPALEGMGTTLVVAVAAGERAVWAHAGDSRLYHLSRGVLAQVTRDHRFLQDLVDSGDVLPEELSRHPLRNVLDQCVGCPGLRPDCGELSMRDGDLLVLTTDGLHDHVGPAMLQEVLTSSPDLGFVSAELMAAARRAGSTDDVSLVIFRFSAGDPA
jgi:protein phosphatase